MTEEESDFFCRKEEEESDTAPLGDRRKGKLQFKVRLRIHGEIVSLSLCFLLLSLVV